MKAIFAGTFDPFTLGHCDIVARSAKIFDSVVVAVAEDTSGKICAPVDKRAEIAMLSVSGIDGVSVVTFSGLLSEFVKGQAPCVLVRGIRNGRDLEYERDRARIYETLGVEQIVDMIARAEYEHISSSAVRELVSLGCSLDGYVIQNAKDMIYQYYSKKKI